VLARVLQVHTHAHTHERERERERERADVSVPQNVLHSSLTVEQNKLECFSFSKLIQASLMFVVKARNSYRDLCHLGCLCPCPQLLDCTEKT
jgi:hypothetical protein